MLGGNRGVRERTPQHATKRSRPPAVIPSSPVFGLQHTDSSLLWKWPDLARDSVGSTCSSSRCLRCWKPRTLCSLPKPSSNLLHTPAASFQAVGKEVLEGFCPGRERT